MNRTKVSILWIISGLGISFGCLILGQLVLAPPLVELGIVLIGVTIVVALVRAKGGTRPFLVSTILLFYVLSAITWLAQLGMGLAFPDDDPRSLIWFDYAASGVLIALKLSAAILLFSLHRIAVTLFHAALLLSVVATVYDRISDVLFVTLGPMILDRGLVGLGILASICIYGWWLGKRGVLTHTAA